MKIKRIISGLILFAIVAAILILGNTRIVSIAVAIVALFAINEYNKSLKKKYKIDMWLGNILAITIAFIDKIPEQFLSIILPTVIAILFLKVIITKMEVNFGDIVTSGFGIIYVIGFLAFIPLIYALENGKLLIWYIAFAAWGTDTFAYLIGCKFGKHKLTPVSPKKSIEGSIAGVIGNVIISLIYTYCINKTGNIEISYLAITGISIILSILAQLGDLAASSIKRYVGIKDFGNLIPGHGGMLDRIDSILFIAPFAYFLLMLI